MISKAALIWGAYWSSRFSWPATASGSSGFSGSRIWPSSVRDRPIVSSSWPPHSLAAWRAGANFSDSPDCPIRALYWS
jgi:hypothetical protein